MKKQKLFRIAARGSIAASGLWLVLAATLAAIASLAVGALGFAGSGEGAANGAKARVEYRRDVRPLLADRCYTCHGPDEKERKSGLRLDMREGALGKLRFGGAAVVPGRAGESELYLRIAEEEAKERMPPPGSGKSLAPEEIELLRRWIEEGAEWEEHWAFAPPVRPELPEPRRTGWARGAIDRFVLARLEAEGLEPSGEAAPEVLARRAALALTGLPPSLEQLDAFLADERPDAYERFVEHLFASPRHAEHQARYWLDAARYGDTHGLHLDNERNLWHWRDWVVGAHDANMPFDEFTTLQLAGDLLPEPTLEQRIATGFHRCTPTTAEGGLIEEEYLVKYAAERVDTTATVWLGLTVACAQCHDHKYDPISQREFYELFAFFHNVAEEGTDRNEPSPAPSLAVPSAEQSARLAELDAGSAALESSLSRPDPAADAAQAEWEREGARELADRWRPLEVQSATSEGGAELALQDDGSLLALGAAPDRDVYTVLARADARSVTALRLEALADERLPLGGAGRAYNANFVLTRIELEILPSGGGEPRAVAFGAARADHSQPGFDVAGALDADPESGWAVLGAPVERVALFSLREPLELEEGSLLRVRLRHESRFAQHAIGRPRLSIADDPELLAVAFGSWHELGPFRAAGGAEAFATDFGPERELAQRGAIDFSAVPDGAPAGWIARPEYRDGRIQRLAGEHSAVYLYREIESPGERALSVSIGSDDGIRLWHDGELALDRDVQRGIAPDQERVDLRLRPGTNRILMKVVNYAGEFAFYFAPLAGQSGGMPPEIERALAVAPGSRTQEQIAALRDHYRAQHSEDWRARSAELEAVRAERARLDAAIPRTMVMQERAERRPTHVLIRGQYDRPGDAVEPGVPAALPPLPAGAPADRLALARWLVDPGHPLTARVTVNRIWQQHFGTGLVRTSEDFGAQGEWPSHPELLDWLARELVESGWDLMHIHLLILGSATWRQDSKAAPDAWRRDPENRLLARGPRFRLDAEVLRDQALFVGGLLSVRRGGPGVRPYQPPGIWEPVAYPTSTTAKYVQGAGEELYRRSLYTFWKRTAPPPSMLAFDAPTRESCTVRRARTNTPLQALVLLNDLQFVEAARGLAERALRADASERLRLAFRMATARTPEPEEARALQDLFEAARAEYAADPEAASALLALGGSRAAQDIDQGELAAWTAVASVLLNLDETVSLH